MRLKFTRHSWQIRLTSQARHNAPLVYAVHAVVLQVASLAQRLQIVQVTVCPVMSEVRNSEHHPDQSWKLYRMRRR